MCVRFDILEPRFHCNTRHNLRRADTGELASSRFLGRSCLQVSISVDLRGNLDTYYDASILVDLRGNLDTYYDASILVDLRGNLDTC